MSGGICEPRHENVSMEHRAAICHPFFVLNSMAVPSQHMENFSRPLEMMQCQEHKPFAGTTCFLKPEPMLKMSSAADDQHQQVTGDNTARVGENVRSDRRITE
jgi:hypothetical protein